MSSRTRVRLLVGRHEDPDRRQPGSPSSSTSSFTSPGNAAGLLRARGVQHLRAYVMEEKNPLLPLIEIRAAAGLPRPHLTRPCGCILGEPEGASGRIRAEEVRRQTEPQDARLGDDDRVGAVAARVPHRPRQGVQVQSGVRSGRPAAAISTDRRWRTSPNPLVVGFYVLQHAGGRIAPVARHLERVSIARRRPSAGGRRCS